MNNGINFGASELESALRVASRFCLSGMVKTVTAHSQGGLACLTVDAGSAIFTASVWTNAPDGIAWKLSTRDHLKRLAAVSAGRYTIPPSDCTPAPFVAARERVTEPSKLIYYARDTDGLSRAFKALGDIPSLHLVLSRFLFQVDGQTTVAALDRIRYGAYSYPSRATEPERFTLPVAAVRAIVEAGKSFSVYRVTPVGEDGYNLSVVIEGVGEILCDDFSGRFPSLSDKRLYVAGDFETATVERAVIEVMCSDLISARSKRFGHVGIRIEGDDVLLYDMRYYYHGDSEFFDGARYDGKTAGATIAILDPAYLLPMLKAMPRVKEVDFKIASSAVEVLPAEPNSLPKGHSLRFSLAPMYYGENVRAQKGAEAAPMEVARQYGRRA